MMRSLLCATSLMATGAVALSLDLNDPSSIKAAASAAAFNLVSYYSGNQSGQIPGELPQPYYWWETGAMFGALIDYWYYTGDTTYNDIVSQGLQFQASPTLDYMPANQTKDEGNDDQVFWAFAVMTAAEYAFPNPPSTEPQWLTLAESVFNSQALRWDNSTCNGGLRWQIFQFNNGYTYKNTPSNAGFMNLGARLYAYTGNHTYADWVNAEWDWLEGVGLISSDWLVFDGTNAPENCTSVDHDQWTYSVGMVMNTAAVMWNATNMWNNATNSSNVAPSQNDLWGSRANSIWQASTNVFFDNKVMLEGCESKHNCDTDQLSFKSYFARYIAASVKWAPWLYSEVQPYLAASATAAAAQCTGTFINPFTSQPLYNSCGAIWTNNGVWDGSSGVGQQMCALQIIQANLIQQSSYPLTSVHGGISKGNASFGTGGDTVNIAPLASITSGDRAGAGILTAIVVVTTLGGTWWLLS